MDVPSIKLSPRTVTGKKVKRLRLQGIIPVHVYGRDLGPSSLQAEDNVLQRILPSVGTNVPLSVEVEGEKGESVCFVREVQRHPVTEALLHVDFMRVDVSRTLQAEVPIVLVGMAPAVRQLGGTLLQPLQNILVESLPMNIPASIELDVSGLEDFEMSIYVSDVTVDPAVTLVTDPNELIARVSAPRIEIEEEAEEEIEEVEEGEEGEATTEEGSAETGPGARRTARQTPSR